MSTFPRLLALALAFAAVPFGLAAAASSSPSTGKSSDQDSAAPYALKTCIVSDEPLGSMGDGVTYTHKQPGKPDRVVRLCCEGCIEDFRANPEKFLKKLDAAEAAAAKKKSGSPAPKS